MAEDERDPKGPGTQSGSEWRRLCDLFGDAQELPESEREAFLDRALEGEPALRAEMDSLLASAATAGTFLAPRDRDATHASSSPSYALGSMVGPYRLVELLGEGGFGIVYLAEQERPIRRRVALKLIKPGMDTRQVIARFGAERQTLAMMDHPSIAQVFDAGETDAARPFFAMEYVPGVPITAFCDAERLRIRERLDLFLDVCDAVQHAHQKGVIHRDLKPSNILVARRDGVPALKVIDFGIVKALGASSDDRSFVTREGMVLGTLGYMSPEQAGAITAEIDTRSDIYSLGVLLYELLSGEMPFDRGRLNRSDWNDAVRILREEDPPSLTARLARSGGATSGSSEQSDGSARVSEIASRRAADERTLLRELRGELEWITLRALEKEPDRRYPSVSELSADVRRHLANEAVLARAPSTAYRVRKFAHRHRVGVTAAAFVLLAIVAGGVAAGIGFARAVRAEHTARREAASARQVADFLVDLFDASTPDRSLGETITARTLLDLGARRIEGDAIEDPVVRARLLSTLASAHGKLGLFDEAIAIERRAVETTSAAAGASSPDLGRELYRLAETMRQAGKVGEMDSLIDRSIAILSEAEGAASSDLAWALYVKGASLGGTDLIRSDSLLVRAVDLIESDARPDTAALAAFYHTKAGKAGARGDFEAQERDLHKALAFAVAAHGERHTRVFAIQRGLAQFYAQRMDREGARRHADEALRLARVIFPADHPSVGLALETHGEALYIEGKLEESAAAQEQALAILQTSYSHDHPNQAWILYVLGYIYRDLGRLDLAIERMRASADMRARLHGATSTRAGDALFGVAELLGKAGYHERADSTFRAALVLLEPLVAAAPHHVASMYAIYANYCRDLGRFSEAESLYTLSAKKGECGSCVADHAYLRSLRGQHAAAESLMHVGMAILENEGNAHSLRGAHLMWAVVRAKAGDADGTIEALERAARAGVDAKQVAQYPELVALRSRPDYPAALRAATPDTASSRPAS